MTATRRLPTDDERVEAEAVEWVMRRGDPAHRPEDDEAFFAWLEADPRHGDEYDEVARALDDIGQLRHFTTLSRVPRRRTWRIVAFSSLPVAACVLLAMAFLLPTFRGPPPQNIESQVAELRVLSLEDGSRITLGGATLLKVAYENNARRVILERGEAFFEVVRDSLRPFLVEAGGTHIRVLGTKFDVRRGVKGVQISVQEGRVEVRDAQALTIVSQANEVLVAGQRTQVQDRPTYVAISAKPLIIESITVAPAGSWRDGRLAYDDVRLEEIVADINRYYAPGVEIVDTEAAEVRVTAAFRTDQIPVFLDALRHTSPLTYRRDQSGRYELTIMPATD